MIDTWIKPLTSVLKALVVMVWNSLSTVSQRLLGVGLAAVAANQSTSVAAAAAIPSFYSLSAVKSDGSIQKMEDFRGKVVYAVNVASKLEPVLSVLGRRGKVFFVYFAFCDC